MCVLLLWHFFYVLFLDLMLVFMTHIVWVYFSKKKHQVIYGKWTECVYSIEPKVYEANKKAEKKSGGDSKKHKQVQSVSHLSLTAEPCSIFCCVFTWKSKRALMHPQIEAPPLITIETVCKLLEMRNEKIFTEV